MEPGSHHSLPPTPVALLATDFDSFLGLTLCLLSNRVVGKTHRKGEYFLLKPALLEQLDNILNTVTAESTLHLSLTNLKNAIVMLLSSSSSVNKVSELLALASDQAWSVFREIYNRAKTMEFLAGFDFDDVGRSGQVFSDLLISLKVATSCAFFRELEIEYNVKDPSDLYKSTIACIDHLLESTFVKECCRKIERFELPKFRKKSLPEKKIYKCDKVITSILRQTLAVDKIIRKYRPHEMESTARGFYAHLEKHPSVFCRTEDKKRTLKITDDRDSAVMIPDGHIACSNSKLKYIANGKHFSIYTIRERRRLHDATLDTKITAMCCDNRNKERKKRMFLSTNNKIIIYNEAEFVTEIDCNKTITTIMLDELVTVQARIPATRLLCATLDNKVLVYNIADLSDVKLTHELDVKADQMCVNVPTDQLFTYTAKTKMLSVIDLETKKVLLSQEVVKPVFSMAVEQYLIILGIKGGLLFYNNHTLELIQLLRTQQSKPVINLSVDRRRNLYSADECLRIWDLEGLNHNSAKSRVAPKQTLRAQDLKMEDCLADPKLRAELNVFLLERLAVENLRFWLDAKRYEQMSEYCSNEARLGFGQHIITEYVLNESPQWINISAAMRKNFEARENDTEFFHAKVFEDPRNEVLKLMQLNFMGDFRKFLEEGR